MIKELEAAALKLEPKDRARLAERLLDSLENHRLKRTRSFGQKRRSAGLKLWTPALSQAAKQTKSFERRGPGSRLCASRSASWPSANSMTRRSTTEYEQPGLGAAFIAEVRRCTVAVAEHPQASPVVLGTIRRRLCQRFPYALLYTVAGRELRILAVMNLKRRPGYWVGRH